MHDSKLTTNPSWYPGSCSQASYYYEAMRVTVAEEGWYTFVYSGNLSITGYMYQWSFYPFDKTYGMVPFVSFTYTCKTSFKITSFIPTFWNYVFVLITTNEYNTEPLSIQIYGPNSVILERMSK